MSKSPGIKKKSGQPRPKQIEEQKTVEELFEELKLRPGIRAGFMRFYGLAQGKRMSIQEFSDKLEAWLHRPLGGQQ